MGTQGTQGLVGGTRKNWWRAWSHFCLHTKDEEGRAGTGGTGIRGAEPSRELQAGGRHYPRSGTPSPAAAPNPKESLATASRGSDGLGGRGKR